MGVLKNPSKSKSDSDRTAKGGKESKKGVKASKPAEMPPKVKTKAKMTPLNNTQKSSRKPVGTSAAKGATPVAKDRADAPSSKKAPTKKASMDLQMNSSRSSRPSGGLTKPRGFSSLLAAESVCREVACEGLATSGGYCRLHYIKNWKKIKRKEVILQEKKLNQYIEELVLKYPDKYIEAIRLDLASDKEFAKVIYDLDLDETVDDFDAENAENVDSLIDTIKRDFDDDSDAF